MLGCLGSYIFTYFTEDVLKRFRYGDSLRHRKGEHGSVRVSAVDSERYLHSDVTGLARFVRGFHYQVGPAETFQFVRGSIRRMGRRRDDELRKTVGYLSPTAIPASAQSDGIAHHSSGRVALTIGEG